MIPPFSINEIEPIRAKKLNELAARIANVEQNGTGGSIVQLDGGNATSSGTPSIVVDGGSS